MNIWILIVIIAVLIIILLVSRKSREKIVGICAAAVESNAKKKERLEKILDMFSQRPEISNAEIRQTLGVSDRSVVRYMDELEREGKVEQVGNTGRGVIYRLK